MLYFEYNVSGRLAGCEEVGTCSPANGRRAP